MPGLRVVLDTNVLVSGLAYPGSVPGRIVTAWRQGGLVPVAGGTLFTLLVLTVLTSAVWYLGSQGVPYASGA